MFWRSDGRRRSAVALRYASGEEAPTVVAAGRGPIAERILAAAREAAVPVREDVVLAETLAVLEPGTVVPAELYAAVAEALVWAYSVGGRRPPVASTI